MAPDQSVYVIIDDASDRASTDGTPRRGPNAGMRAVGGLLALLPGEFSARPHVAI
jgi:hypothetical protein